MGGTTSKLGGQITRDQLLKSTQPMRLLMDEALKLMMEKLTKEDLRKLREPAECAKYIVLIGNAFEKYFQSIDVVPVLQKGQKGATTIYFQRADALTGVGATAEKNQVCKTIAYFFTRFFQILNALAYSVFDDGRTSAIGAAAASGMANQFGILPPAAFAQQPRLVGPVLQTGGAAYELNQRPYDIFAPYVFYERTDSNGVKYYRFAGVQNAVMIMKLGGDIVSEGLTSYNAIFTYRGMGDDNVITLYCSITTRGDAYILTIIKARVKIGGEVFEPAVKKYESKFSKLDFRKIRNKYTTSRKIYRDDKIELIPKILESLFIYIYNNRTNIKNNVSPDLLPLFWGSLRDVSAAADGTLVSEVAAAAAAAAPKLAGIPQARPLAHCIARSMQLLTLDIAAPIGGRKAWSFVCEPKFMNGIPASGQPITSSPAIKSLDMLFTTFREGVAVAMTKENVEYMNALEKMNALYGDGVAAAAGPASFDAIVNRRDDTACAAAGIKGALPITDRGKINTLNVGVQNLWKIQIEHAKRVSAILEQLFIKDKKTGKLGINPQLLSVGVVGLDMIAAAAREMLLNYYTACETTYQTAAMAVRGT